MADMDIEMDLDIDPLPEEQLFEEGETVPATSEAVPIDTDIPLAYTDQTLDIQPNKVHIRGVDEATTNDIRAFSKEYFTLADPVRIEWIDDTSANILYSTNEFASKALEALTLDPLDPAIASDPLVLRATKQMPSRPDATLQIRPALFSDKKKARAHEASRFYLMHPEHDPRERMRIERKRGGRAGGENGDYNRRRYDDREHRRRRDQDGAEGDSGATFNASMYDDVDTASANGEARGRDLFSRISRSRARSASPAGFHSSDSSDEGRSRRFRSRRSPPPRRRDFNASKELFPLSATSSNQHSIPDGSANQSLLSRERNAPPQTREIYPTALTTNKSIASSLKKELFPHKTALSNHRHTHAIDAATDETANLFARKLSTSLSDESPSVGPSPTRKELFPGTHNGTDENGISVKGSAGISIKGRGAGTTAAREVKELFPERYNGAGGGDNSTAATTKRNRGKELFNDVLEGRGGRRRKAEDLFE